MKASKEIAKKAAEYQKLKGKSMICTKNCKSGLPKEILKIFISMDSG
ncbi:MAG: hypothetical protein ACLVEO_13615 [Lachnospiraceae bacterium]